MYIQLASFKLKKNADEKTLIEASDEFERVFVKKQRGIIQRVLMRDKYKTYADLVFFESKEAADKILAAEESHGCHALAFFAITEMNETLPEGGILSFEEIKTYK